MARTEKIIEKANREKMELEEKYSASVVWMGGNKFIIVKDGKETIVEV